MSFTRGQEVHPGVVWIWREPTEQWTQETCSFCGSIKPAIAADWLDSGNNASGSDWKYGWPHKFYVTDTEGKEWKLYSEHLAQLGPEEFGRVTRAIGSVLGVWFEYDMTDKMLVKAPEYGYQRWRREGKTFESDVETLREWEIRQDKEILGE